MGFPNTPHQFSRIAARFMLVFFLAPFVLSLLEYMLFAFGFGFFHTPGASASDLAGVFWLGWAFSTMASSVFEAFAYTLLGWVIASVGVLVASRGPALAALIFGFAAIATSPGLWDEYWYVTVWSVVILVWLALAAWSLRQYVHQAQIQPGDAEDILRQQQALNQRDINTENLISRR